jgi:prepilin-type N-terminal cleavage/methylation domain-containing protein
MLSRQQDLPISKRRTVRAGEPASARRTGFTLVEMMVAVVILAVGLLGLTTTGAYVLRMVSGGQQQTIAASVVQSRLERLRSLPCLTIVSAGNRNATTRGIKEQWRPGVITNQVLFVDYNVKYQVAGSKRDQSYTFTIPCW